MKAIKSLLALSVLAATGVANAATVATFTVTATGTSAFSTSAATGTGTLDSDGTLSLHFDSSTTTVPGLGAATIGDINDTFLGSISGNTYTIASGTEVMNGPCTGTAIICGTASTGFGTPYALTIVDGDALVAGNSTISYAYTSNGVANNFTYNLVGTAVSEVPVPAAAWLFGSGLLALAGTARRRRAN